MSVYLYGGMAKITIHKRLTEEIRAERIASPNERIPVVALLENLRSAHNVGSFFRTADAFGLAELWLSGYTCRPPHVQLDKVALGATETVPWRGFAVAAEAVAAAGLPEHRSATNADVERMLEAKLGHLQGAVAEG